MADQSEEISAEPRGGNPKRPRLQSGRPRGRKRLKNSVDLSPRHEQQAEVSGEFQILSTAELTTSSEITGHGGVDPSILAQYKAWKRAGNPHDTVCFECHGCGDLDPCETCCRSYHQACKPNGSLYSNHDGLRCWYCPVCVGRKWHIIPPPLTPPDSPGLSPSRVADSRASHTDPNPAGNSNAAHSQHELASQGSFNSRVYPASTLSLPDSEQLASSNLPATRVNLGQPISSGSNTALATGARGIQRTSMSRPPQESNVGSASRKSRFSTLSKDVDSALWVLNCELEHIPLLRQKISDLESQLSSLRQQLDIKQNELTLSRSMSDKLRASEAEIYRLRTEINKRQMETNEMEALRARNQELELELGHSQRHVESSTKTLQEWKHKLSSMLGDG